MPKDKALAIIRNFSGTQFDAHYAAVFIQLDESGQLDHVIGHSDEGIPLQSCPMCGPTLVIQHEHKAGDHIYCRNCSSEFSLENQNRQLIAQPTGKKGQPADLEPELDAALIARTVQAAVAALPIEALLSTSDLNISIP